MIWFAGHSPIAKHTKVDMIWVTGRSPTLVSHSLRGAAMNLKATILTYLAIVKDKKMFFWVSNLRELHLIFVVFDFCGFIAKHAKVDMIWVAGCSPTLVSQNLKGTTLTYLAIPTIFMIVPQIIYFDFWG